MTTTQGYSPRVSRIVTNRDKDCFNVLDPTDSSGRWTTPITFSISEYTSKLYKTGMDLFIFKKQLAFDPDKYFYKVFKHKVSVTSQAGYAFEPVFKCQGGYLLAKEDLSNTSIDISPGDKVDREVNMITL